jgi:hypothetical protein
MEHEERKPRGRPRIARRWTVADTGYSSPCWLSTLWKAENGYARERRGKSTGYAHRHAFEQAHGSIPGDVVIDHLCRVRACVNPDHLEAVSCAENVRRGRGTKLDAAHVRAIRASTDKQSVLARRFGISQSQVSRIVTGQSCRGIE